MRGFADLTDWLTEILWINSIPGISWLVGWLVGLHRRGGNPSQYWGKLTFTVCELSSPQWVVFLSGSLCLSLFTEQNTLLRLRHSPLMSAYFAGARWPPHIYKSIKGEGAKIFYPQWRLRSSKLIMGTKTPGSGWWRWRWVLVMGAKDAIRGWHFRSGGQHFLILPNPNYRV